MYNKKKKHEYRFKLLLTNRNVMMVIVSDIYPANDTGKWYSVAKYV